MQNLAHKRKDCARERSRDSSPTATTARAGSWNRCRKVMHFDGESMWLFSSDCLYSFSEIRN